MKVIVTGSSGRVGRAVRAALGIHHEVLGVDVSPSSSTDVVASIEDRVVLERVLGGADAVVHAAGLHAPHVGRAPDSRFWEVNVTATRLLAGLCVQVGVPRLIFTSTTALYGRASTRADAASWVTEETPPSPRTIYHRTKLSAEAVLRDASRAGELDVVVIRMARCFPESAPVMAVFRMHRGVDVRDVAELHVTALVAPTRGFRIFIGAGCTPFLPTDVVDLRVDAGAVIRRRAPHVAAAFDARGWALPRSIDRVYIADRARRELGWTARFGPDEVLAELDSRSPQVLPPPPQT